MKNIIFTIALFTTCGIPAFAHEHASGTENEHTHVLAVGKPGNAAEVKQTIEIQMNDAMRFEPAEFKVKKGDTVRLRVKNVGQVKHEFILGNKKELKEHAAMMKKMPQMQHSDPNQIMVEPGATGEIIWKFTKVGSFDYACFEPGHFEAGMLGRAIVK